MSAGERDWQAVADQALRERGDYAVVQIAGAALGTAARVRGPYALPRTSPDGVLGWGPRNRVAHTAGQVQR